MRDGCQSVHTDRCAPIQFKGDSTQDIAQKHLGKVTLIHLLVTNLCFYQFQTDKNLMQQVFSSPSSTSQITARNYIIPFLGGSFCFLFEFGVLFGYLCCCFCRFGVFLCIFLQLSNFIRFSLAKQWLSSCKHITFFL